MSDNTEEYERYTQIAKERPAKVEKQMYRKQAKHQQPMSQQSKDNKFGWVIQQNLDDLKKNPKDTPR